MGAYFSSQTEPAAVEGIVVSQGPLHAPEASSRASFHAVIGGAAGRRRSRRAAKQKAEKAPLGLQVVSRLVWGSVHDCYAVSCEVVGRGSSGPLYACTSKINCRTLCLKFFNKKKRKAPPMNKGSKRQQARGAEALAQIRIRNEINVSVRVDHPNIARLIEVFEDEQQLFMITEYCSGEDLYSHLQRCGRFPENQAKQIVLQMLQALSYLHAHNVVHRDLRLEKWVFAAGYPESETTFFSGKQTFPLLKLVDLGHAKIWFDRSKKMNAACSTLPYASPDLLTGGYTEACDMWSLGVIVYQLLCGRPPFHGTPTQMIDQILSGIYTTSTPGWQGVSAEAKDFVCRLLDVDPIRRLTAFEAIAHPWLVMPSIKQLRLPPDFLYTLKKFSACTKVKRTILTMMAYSVTTEMADGLDRLFLALCSPTRGTISFNDFMQFMQARFLTLSAYEIADIFHSMDSTQSNEIRYNDFLAAMMSVRLRRKDALLVHTFRKCDVDRSGYISLNDLRVILGDQYRPDALEEVMRDFDSNGNGRIDLEEFIDAIREDEEFDSFSTAGSSAKPSIIVTPHR